jgi:hypothetical protein
MSVREGVKDDKFAWAPFHIFLSKCRRSCLFTGSGTALEALTHWHFFRFHKKIKNRCADESFVFFHVSVYPLPDIVSNFKA